MAFTVWQVGPELKVNEITDGDQQAPSATALADGGWVVAWQSLAQDGTGWNIHQRRYDGAGVPDGAESIVNVAASDDQQSPGVTALADGGWIVTWQGDEPGGAPGDVYQRRYDGTGAPVTADILVNETTLAPQVIPTAAALADSGWVVT
jgi:hypothetical protein